MLYCCKKHAWHRLCFCTKGLRMKTIGANCREQFRIEDFEFVATALNRHGTDSQALAELLTDPTARDAALESDRVVEALVRTPDPLPVSPQFYFYVLTRRGLARFDRVVADYIANVLTTFLDLDRMRTMPTHAELQTEYLSDMLDLLKELGGEAAFVARAHVGNYSLFVSGIFADHIRYREWRRGAPGISYYEQIGSANYRLASDHRQAQEEGLDLVLRTISERFSEVRQGLNAMADRFLHLESEPGES